MWFLIEPHKLFDIKASKIKANINKTKIEYKNFISELLTVYINQDYNNILKANFFETPIGEMISISSDDALYLLEFIDRKALPTEIKKLKIMTKSQISISESKISEFLKNELDLYFSSKLVDFKTPLAEFGTTFYKLVWNELKNIPIGQTRSYLEISRKIGKESASRAVARANGANQISIIIPCHRVIGSDGSLTGYSGGLWRKKWLLDNEKQIANKI